MDQNAADFAGKRLRALEDTSNGNGDDDILSWLSIEIEEDELSMLLETQITSPVKVKFIDNPYSMPEIFQSSSSFITINGNEESCGSSFSDSDSSVMASIDLSGVTRGFHGVAWELDAKNACGGDGMDKETDCYYEYDDEMLARFIGEEIFKY